jgi:hypothetical protein
MGKFEHQRERREIQHEKDASVLVLSFGPHCDDGHVWPGNGTGKGKAKCNPGVLGQLRLGGAGV